MSHVCCNIRQRKTTLNLQDFKGEKMFLVSLFLFDPFRGASGMSLKGQADKPFTKVKRLLMQNCFFVAFRFFQTFNASLDHVKHIRHALTFFPGMIAASGFETEVCTTLLFRGLLFFKTICNNTFYFTVVSRGELKYIKQSRKVIQITQYNHNV